MAKGVHSKRRKRNQSIKRKVLEESKIIIFNFLEIWRPRLEETSKRLFKRTFGSGDDSVITNKKNAFRYPNNPDAIIPQAEPPVHIDKRSKAVKKEFLIQDKGVKNKNLKKKANEDALSTALQRVRDKVAGTLRENDVIDLNDMIKLDEYGNIDVDNIDMDKSSLNTVEKKKKIPKKNNIDHMDMDDNSERKAPLRTQRKNNKKKKNKSYYLVNY
jgi:hypothetical protein